MDVKLIVANGKHIGEKVPVSGPKFIIGRSEECQLRPRSDLISRHHCAVVIEEGYVGVRDFGSKNGTFVNGERVRGEQELRNGDRISIGQLEFLVELVVNVSGKKKPKVHSVQEAAARTVESSGGDELDLANWLSDGDTTPGSSAYSETQTIPGASVRDTAPAVNAQTAAAEKAAAEKAAAERAAAEKEAAERKVADKAVVEKKTAEWEAAEREALEAAEKEAEKQREEAKRAKAAAAWAAVQNKSAGSSDSREAAANVLKAFFNRH